MRYYLQKTLLSFLRSLIYIKRALVFSFRTLGRAWSRCLPFFRTLFGVPLYTVLYRLRRLTNILQLPSSGPWTEWIGKRSVLQIGIFLLGLTVMIPHSTLYTKDITAIPGRATALYHIIGPGEQDFEEIIVETARPNLTGQTEESSLWRQGLVEYETPGGNARIPTEISGISAGGTVLTKPTILPGNQLPSPSGEQREVRRSAIVIHQVDKGETVGGIAEAYNITVETVLWANSLTARSFIRPGDRLKILPTSGVVHTVKSGENVGKIAQIYDIAAEEVIAFNNLQKGGSDIVIGEELMIPGGKKSAPPVPRLVPKPSSSFRQIAAPPPSTNAPAGSGYLWPTGVRHITQYFGWRHTGLDIAGPVGTAVYAAKGGTVIKSQPGWNGGYGTYIIIDHGDGLQTLYGHNTQLFASVGDVVAQGQTIASMGSTGRSTGPHLHFEVRVNGGRLNPLKYIR